MDECISNLVVTENFVVQPVENIPISMVEGTYENGLVQLVTASSHTPAGPGKSKIVCKFVFKAVAHALCNYSY
jgi:hypothetical protein